MTFCSQSRLLNLAVVLVLAVPATAQDVARLEAGAGRTIREVREIQSINPGHLRANITSTAGQAVWFAAIDLLQYEPQPLLTRYDKVPVPGERALIPPHLVDKLPFGRIIMRSDGWITQPDKPPIVKLPEPVMRSSWRCAANVRDQMKLMSARATVEPPIDPVPPPAPVSEPLD